MGRSTSCHSARNSLTMCFLSALRTSVGSTVPTGQFKFLLSKHDDDCYYFYYFINIVIVIVITIIYLFFHSVMVKKGQVIQWTSTSATQYPGFELCYFTTSSGGGIALVGGNLVLSSSQLQGNVASRFGGGIYLSVGRLTLSQTTIHGNAAAVASAVYIASGVFHAKSLFINGEVSGVSASSAVCLSPCGVLT